MALGLCDYGFIFYADWEGREKKFIALYGRSLPCPRPDGRMLCYRRYQ